MVKEFYSEQCKQMAYAKLNSFKIEMFNQIEKNW